ncbi:unnamed protein product, partial [Aphanomyces euteiches]
MATARPSKSGTLLLASDIQRDLKSTQDSKTFDIPENKYGKSTIWSKFGIVYKAKSGEKTDFAACKDCNKTFVFKERTGTSTLAEHKCNIPVPAEKLIYRNHKATPGQKSKMTSAIADFCATDLRPFECVE